MSASCTIDKVPEKRVFLGSPNPSRHTTRWQRRRRERDTKKNVVAVCLLSTAFFYYSAKKISSFIPFFSHNGKSVDASLPNKVC